MQDLEPFLPAITVTSGAPLTFSRGRFSRAGASETFKSGAAVLIMDVNLLHRSYCFLFADAALSEECCVPVRGMAVLLLGAACKGGAQSVIPLPQVAGSGPRHCGSNPNVAPRHHQGAADAAAAAVRRALQRTQMVVSAVSARPSTTAALTWYRSRHAAQRKLPCGRGREECLWLLSLPATAEQRQQRASCGPFQGRQAASAVAEQLLAAAIAMQTTLIRDSASFTQVSQVLSCSGHFSTLCVHVVGIQ